MHLRLIALGTLAVAAACDSAPLHNVAARTPPPPRHAPLDAPPLATPPERVVASAAAPEQDPNTTRALPPSAPPPSDDWVHDCGTQLFALEPNDLIRSVVDLHGKLAISAVSGVYVQGDDGSFVQWDTSTDPLYMVTDGAALFASHTDYNTEHNEVFRVDGLGARALLFDDDAATSVLAAAASLGDADTSRVAWFRDVVLVGDELYVLAWIGWYGADGYGHEKAFLVGVNKAGGAPVVHAEVDERTAAIAASDDGSTIYVAGDGIAHFDVGSGTLAPWFDAATAAHDATVTADDAASSEWPMSLTVDGDDVFFVGWSPVARVSSSSGAWRAYDHVQMYTYEGPVSPTRNYVYWTRLPETGTPYLDGVVVRAARNGVAGVELANDCVAYPSFTHVHGGFLDIVTSSPPSIHRVPLHE